MASDKRSSNRWRDEHESLLLRICTKSENRPIGGPTDGKMAYAKELWQRIHVEFMAELPQLNSTLQSKRNSMPRSEFSPEDLQRRFVTWNKMYQSVSQKFDIRIRDKPGATGSAASGVMPDKHANAVADWHLWAEYHEAFGLCARVRTDAGSESMPAWQFVGTHLCSTCTRLTAFFHFLETMFDLHAQRDSTSLQSSRRHSKQPACKKQQ
jgi:hypothetical protein